MSSLIALSCSNSKLNSDDRSQSHAFEAKNHLIDIREVGLNCRATIFHIYETNLTNDIFLNNKEFQKNVSTNDKIHLLNMQKIFYKFQGEYYNDLTKCKESEEILTFLKKVLLKSDCEITMGMYLNFINLKRKYISFDSLIFFDRILTDQNATVCKNQLNVDQAQKKITDWYTNQ